MTAASWTSTPTSSGCWRSCGTSTGPFERLVDVVRQAADSDRIRLDRVEQAAEQEWDLATRQRWHRLRERLGPKVAV
jgi:hypothetical protein